MKMNEMTIDPDRLENGAWVDDIPEMEGLRTQGAWLAEFRLASVAGQAVGGGATQATHRRPGRPRRHGADYHIVSAQCLFAGLGRIGRR